jgi:NADH dehydrogenase (ubiquinone) Fe-S protein 1
MNSRLRGVEDSDLLLLVGTNPKIESPVFNARIRKAVMKNNLKVGLIGTQYDLTYDYEHLGITPKSLIDILEGKHPFSSRIANVTNLLI